MPLTSSILALRLYLQHENTMKLPLLFAILTMTTALSAQNLKISPTIEQQLKELDEIVENKATYHAERNKPLNSSNRQKAHKDKDASIFSKKFLTSIRTSKWIPHKSISTCWKTCPK